MSKKIEKISTECISKKDIEEIKSDLNEIKTITKEFKKSLKGLVEIQQRLIHERLGVPVPAPPNEYGEETTAKTAKINIISIADDRIRVSGNTFDFKAAIKEAGFAKWEQGTKSWALPSDCLNKLIKNLEAVNLVNGTDFSVNVEESTNKKEESEVEDVGGFGSGFND